MEAGMKDTIRMIKWNKKHLTGIKEMDDQHKELITAVNELVQHCTRGGTDMSAYISKIIQVTSGFVREHFADEERLMEESGYPDLEEHRRQHGGFIRVTSALAREFEDGKRALPPDLACFLSAWIIGHIKNTDRKYAGYMLSKRMSHTA
jgi:hemerythrin-like metal-binding protein